MGAEHAKTNRCAIYTRKSSEEGLDQTFNSLDAQREACEAYIVSQRHEGWRLLPARYDDGGFSGGTMDRPALKQLLADVEKGKISTVVVYKVDRLTRSLADFARMIEILDTHQASFVSVTQQFNTTTSMGRLTLNVLLSFAQFEREVTGERIRDKIAASKRKGMWMGGMVPLGYQVKSRKLVVVPVEAERVRGLYRRYLELGCVSKLKAELDRKGFKSKQRVSSSGRKYGGAPYSRGALYAILQNPIYRGEIHHRGHVYQGEHETIIPQELWQQVQAGLRGNNEARRTGLTAKAPSLLTGLLYDAQGNRFTPSHAVKNGKRYRYYVSQAAIQGKVPPRVARIPAREIESLVSNRILTLLRTSAELLPRRTTVVSKTAKELLSAAQAHANLWEQMGLSDQRVFLEAVIHRITVHEREVEILMRKKLLYSTLLGAWPATNGAGSGQTLIQVTAEASLMRAGGEVRIVAPSALPPATRLSIPLVKAVARARDWYEKLVSGELTGGVAISRAEKLDERYVSRILRCAFLAPDLVDMILDGRQPLGLGLDRLLRQVPLEWTTQRSNVGYPRYVGSGLDA